MSSSVFFQGKNFKRKRLSFKWETFLRNILWNKKFNTIYDHKCEIIYKTI